MTVYVVLCGPYYDVAVQGIFSTREKAETYAGQMDREWLPASGMTQVVEYELDATPPLHSTA